ncbi:MAG: Glucose-1-phosphate cytidylyltransferase [Candidatus Accumulibacter sp. BA-94]|uniref:glucose-1-phosphate cytidylyltransferase n=1 Tax=Accumulibacter sp. TaxID=2053492 RepID=UPI00044CED26|nr:glucose-1-phosphate cytidylyltransferase [Accumulibacter sp.]EXI83885.1 MAG: Glucose-1-phosphate cytidylyltransferase [Candidatus Accumulibacter sp. BA-94]HRD86873.1 glucose-1-phosphate cytidylyltransferase [Accumulibacter sp.]
MKAVILAGGAGTRLAEETIVRPKPMVEIGGKPMIWHIMKIYSSHGINDFVICLGYRGYVIKEYFANYFLHMSDVTLDLASNRIEVHERHAEPWRVTLIDTGDATQTGGRLRRARAHVENEELFCMTYGDGVGNIDIAASIDFHRQQRVLATVTAVTPPGRFGALELSADRVLAFQEKPAGDGAWINGGFFVLSPRVIDLIDGDSCMWEAGPVSQLSRSGQLAAWRHDGFWHAMDTLRDRNHLEQLWASGSAPWKTW